MPEIHSADIVAAAAETHSAATDTAETAASDAVEPASTDTTETTSANAVETASAAVETASAAVETASATVETASATVEPTTATVEPTTATAMKCRRDLRRHDGRRRRQKDCADRYTDFIHDYLPHHLSAMLLSEAAPHAQHSACPPPEGQHPGVPPLRQDPVILIIVTDLAEKMAGLASIKGRRTNQPDHCDGCFAAYLERLSS